MGSFLKSYAKWRKKPKTKSEALDDKQLNSWITERSVKVQVYSSTAASPLASADDFLVSAHLQCEVEFDPEKDYAQVLAEARTHLKLSGATETPSHESVCSSSNRTSWLQASSQEQLDAYRELECKLGKIPKPSRRWKHFLFWQRPSFHHHEAVGADFSSIFSTPQHPAFQQSCKGTCNNQKKVKGNGTKLTNYSGPRPTKGNSGPLYTDGLPCGPSNIRHTKKSHSGPLATLLSFSNGSSASKDLADLSPYEPLRRPQPPSPLYSC